MVEIGVCVINKGFKRNLTQLTIRYDQILVHLYVLLNRASITEPFSVTCVLAMYRVGLSQIKPVYLHDDKYF